MTELLFEFSLQGAQIHCANIKRGQPTTAVPSLVTVICNTVIYHALLLQKCHLPFDNLIAKLGDVEIHT